MRFSCEGCIGLAVPATQTMCMSCAARSRPLPPWNTPASLGVPAG